MDWGKLRCSQWSKLKYSTVYKKRYSLLFKIHFGRIRFGNFNILSSVFCNNLAEKRHNALFVFVFDWTWQFCSRINVGWILIVYNPKGIPWNTWIWVRMFKYVCFIYAFKCITEIFVVAAKRTIIACVKNEVILLNLTNLLIGCISENRIAHILTTFLSHFGRWPHNCTEY